MPKPVSFTPENLPIYNAIIQKLYGLENIVIKNVPAGIQNYNFIITKDDKPLYFLSIKRQSQGEKTDEAHQQKLLAVQKALSSSKEVIVPEIVSGLNDALLQTIGETIEINGTVLAIPEDIKGLKVVLYGYMKGEEISPGDAKLVDWKDMGQQHGKFLAAGKKLLQEHPEFRDLENPVSFTNLGKMLLEAFAYEPESDIDLILSKETELKEHESLVISSLKTRIAKDEDKNANSALLVKEFINRVEGGWYENTLRSYSELKKVYDTFPPMDLELLHGDMHFGNQFAGQAGIFDMDWMSAGDGFIDIFQPLVLNARAIQKAKLPHFSTEKAAIYIEALEMHRPLTDFEKDNINLLVEMAHFRSTATRLISMIKSENIASITKSPIELTDLRERFKNDFKNINCLTGEIMAKSKICLIATEIGLLDEQAAKDAIAASGAFYHSARVIDGELTLDDGASIENLKDDKVHFVHIGKQQYPETLVKITANGDFRGVIVAPEKVLPAVKAEYFGRCGSGVNNLPIAEKEKADERFVATNTPGGNSVGTAFHTVRSILELAGDDGVFDKKITVVGGGHIGKKVAITLNAMGANVTVWNRSELKNITPGITYRFGDIKNSLKGAEIVSIHLPENVQTKGFIGADEIALLADGAKVVNFGRPAVNDIAALEAAIKSGKITGVAIDGDYFGPGDARSVLEPFIKMINSLDDNLPAKKNMLALPHIGGDTVQQDRERVMIGQINQFIDFVEKGIAHNLQSPENTLPDGIKKAAVEEKTVRAVKEPKIKKLLELGQKQVLEHLKKIVEEGLRPLRQISDETLSGALCTGTEKFKELYCRDFSGREIELPYLTPDISSALAQIIEEIGGKPVQKEQEKSWANRSGISEAATYAEAVSAGQKSIVL
ncbi:MAG: phosphoglycerate dehydrogenase [Rickettsiaceae bacterium]|jgi:phosphoglycerate dehydrogenase-like enzyme/Ser/Thr protein kinase RdoA (MazF antagonist)|nr:phosphoglycerate dehydrogenase [Rickettsiaceae bacterium]